MCGPGNPTPTIRFPALALLILLALPGLTVLPAAASQRVEVFLDTENPRHVDLELTISSITVESAVGSARFRPSRPVLSARDLDGRQIHLGGCRLPAGPPSRVLVTVDAVSGTLGGARLSPDAPAEPIVVGLPSAAGDDPATVLFLRWFPQAVREDEAVHAPRIEGRTDLAPPLGTVVYVTDRGSGLLLAVDAAAERVAAGTWLGEGPADVVYLRSEGVLLAALGGDDALAVVEPQTLRLRRTVPLAFGDRPERLLISAREERLYVLNRDSRSLTALTLPSLQTDFRLPLDTEPVAMAEDESTGYVYVAGVDTDRIQVIDPARQAAVSTVTAPTPSASLAMAGDGDHLLLGSAAHGGLARLALATGAASGRVNLCGPVGELAVDPRNGRVYATVPQCREIAVAEPGLGLELSPMGLPSTPRRIAFDGNARRLLATLPDAGALAVCDPLRRRLVAVIDMGGAPWGVTAP